MSKAAPDVPRKIMYQLLVESDGDLIGLVAYALYKQHKRDWILQHQERFGKPPSDEETAIFVDSNALPAQIGRLRVAANELIQAYGKVLVENARPLIASDAISERIEAAAENIEKAGGIGNQVWVGIVSSFFYTVLLILLVILLKYGGIDIVSIVKSITGS